MEAPQPYIERLLNLSKYSQNIKNDPLWENFPLRTLYEEELEKDSQAQYAKNSIFADVNSSKQIGPLKNNRGDKRDRNEKRQSELSDGWFGMKAQEITDDHKNDYVMLKLKKYIDPKNPTKSSDFQKIPKFFQVGTFIDDGFNDGVVQTTTRVKRQAAFIDQFLELDNVKSFIKYKPQQNLFSRKKFGELQQSRQKDSKVNQKLKKLRKFTKKLKVTK